ncbi:hypothetical protein Tco_0617579 [Tanacetum coccineum]
MDWRTSAPKDGMSLASSYSAANVAALNTNRTPFQKLPKTLLYLVGLSRNYYLGDDVYPTFLYDDDREMDLFGLICNPNPFKVKTGTRPRAAHEVLLLTATMSRVICMEDTTVATGSSGTTATIEKSPLDFDNENHAPSTTKGVIQEPVLEKEVAAMGPPMNKRHRQRDTDEVEANAPPKVLRKDRTTPIPHRKVVLIKSYVSHNMDADLPRERIPRSSPNMLLPQREEEIKKLDEEIKSLRIVETEVHGLRNQTQNLETLFEAEVSNLQAQVIGEERIKVVFEEFKKYEDDKVEQWCAEMNARLDALSIDFDEELYPHMLTAIALFIDVVSAGIVKGMSEGLKHGLEHREATLDLAAIEGYDPEADAKYVAALQALKDLKFLLVDQLEKLKDAPIDLIMTSLHLEGDFGEGVP